MLNPKILNKSILASIIAMTMTACGGGGGHGGGGGDDPDPEGQKVSPVKSSTCVNMQGENENAPNFATCFDWKSDNTKLYFKLLVKNMMEKYKIDGWRLDQAYQVPNAVWKDINRQVAESAEANNLLGFTVAEVWDGDGAQIERSVLKNHALDSAFNFPLRYQLVKVIAGQENNENGNEKLSAAANLAGEWGYGNYIRYTDKNVMPAMFIDNHDVVRLGNLLFRWNLVNEADVSGDEYSLRHLLALAFETAYTGPITIYYGDEYGDYLAGWINSGDDCGNGEQCWDDNASRTQGVANDTELAAWQKELRNKTAALMEFRKETPAMFNGKRYHIYSTTEKPSSENSANFYVDVKKANDSDDAYVFIMSTSAQPRTLALNDNLSKYLCQKAIGSDVCRLTKVIDTTENGVKVENAEAIGSNLVFNMEAWSAKIYKVEEGEANQDNENYTVTNASAISALANYDDTINSFTCFKGENPEKCGLIIYQVMVEAAVNGGDGTGKGKAWGPSEHNGTMGGIKNSLNFIKGSGANALWITPVFHNPTSSDATTNKTYSTGYYSDGHYRGDEAYVDDDFGGLASLKELISAVHAKNMYFILDGVFGHASKELKDSKAYINIEEE